MEPGPVLSATTPIAVSGARNRYFPPGAGTQPFLGQVGELEEADEFRLELSSGSGTRSSTTSHAEAHPYEE